MTNREAISQIKGLLREVNADSRLPSKLIFSILSKHTKWLIARDSDALKLIKKSNSFQVYKCVDVIEAPAIDDCCGIKSFCKVWRTKDKLPEMVEDSYGPIIKAVTTIDNITNLTASTPKDIERKKSNPWLNKLTSKKNYFYNDGYVYFPNGGFKKVNIEALFLGKVKNNCINKPLSFESKKCTSFLDTPFVGPDYLLAQIFDFTAKELATYYSRLPEKSQEINKSDNLKG